MRYRKLTTELTEDELIALATSDTKELETEEMKASTSDVVNFISAYAFKNGKNDVLGVLLFELYKKWSEDTVSIIEFYKKLMSFFPRRIKGTAIYFRISSDKINLLEEIDKLERKKKDRRKSKRVRKHFERFLTHYNIVSGKDHVEDFVFKFMYDRWCYENKRKPQLSRDMVRLFMRLYFTYDSKDAFQVDLEKLTTVFSIDSYNNIRQSYYEKTKKQTRKGQVKSIKT
jgi:hypothetical protein